MIFAATGGVGPKNKGGLARGDVNTLSQNATASGPLRRAQVVSVLNRLSSGRSILFRERITSSGRLSDDSFRLLNRHEHTACHRPPDRQLKMVQAQQTYGSLLTEGSHIEQHMPRFFLR